MAKPVTRKIVFDAKDRARIARCCGALGTTFEEFARVAILQAVDECEGIAREVRR